MAAKKTAQKAKLDSGLALALVAYGMVLGYYLGESQAEKKAAKRAEQLRIKQTLSDLQYHVHRLENPELYKEEADHNA